MRTDLKASSPIFAALRAGHEAASRRRLVESLWSALALFDRLVRDEDGRQLELVEDDFVAAAGGARVPLIDEDPPEDDGENAALRHRLACIREALLHDDVVVAKLLASEAPTRAEGPHGAGLVGASGRGAGEGGDA